VLTARQREVLKLVAAGKSTKEIAFLLNLSVKTVETHRAQIMERLASATWPAGALCLAHGPRAARGLTKFFGAVY